MSTIQTGYFFTIYTDKYSDKSRRVT